MFKWHFISVEFFNFFLFLSSISSWCIFIYLFFFFTFVRFVCTRNMELEESEREKKCMKNNIDSIKIFLSIPFYHFGLVLGGFGKEICCKRSILCLRNCFDWMANCYLLVDYFWYWYGEDKLFVSVVISKKISWLQRVHKNN